MKESCYLILENRRERKWQAPRFAIVGTRKTKPALAKNQVAILLNVELPDKTFDEFIPEASMTIPDELMLRPNVEVTVSAPDSASSAVKED